MDSEQLYLQHSKRLSEVMDAPIVDLEPHPVKLETWEEFIERSRNTIALILTRAWCKLNEKQQLLYTMQDSITFTNADVHQQISIGQLDQIRNGMLQLDVDGCQFGTPQVVHNLAQNRPAFIHKCIHCDTRDEKHGVGIYDIVCDNCSHLQTDKIFLTTEDFKHETLIWIDEE